jgi:SAM-dependent MidA family methyltransferase
MAGAGADPVGARLRAAAAGGPLRFDRFVEIALYAPGGFYDRPVPPLGREGAFYTAAHTTPLLGATLADHLVAERARRPDRGPFRIVEVGPGDGTLALDTARALPAGDSRWTWSFVERSPTLRANLSERIAREGVGTAVDFEFQESVGVNGSFRGVVIANELLDALPFRRLVRRGGAWRELGVREEGGGWTWAEMDATPTVVGEPLPEAKEGTRYDLIDRAEGFVREVADALSFGSAIVFDYGATTDELLRGHSAGSLAAVRDHRAVDPLETPGTADLSAFVDFTRVRWAARQAGWAERSFRGQAEALGAWGFGPRLEAAVARAASPEEGVRLRLAAKNLLFGFETFHVLELEAGGGPAATS